MAIAKWIPFGTPQPSAATPEDVKTQAVALGCSADGKQFGLENFGNTCYANSVLQALYFCGPFRELVIQSPDPSTSQIHVPITSSAIPLTPPTSLPQARRKLERKLSTTGHSPDLSPTNPSTQITGIPIPTHPPTLFSALRSLFLHISKNTADKGTVSPRAFIDKLKEVNESFRSSMHQDAHEFLNYLLNKIVEEIEEERKHCHTNHLTGEDLSNSIGTLSSRSPPTTVDVSSNSGTSPQDATIVHRLFEGILTSETRCLTCETVSSRDESFLDLSIDIEQNSSVTACLRQFSASEMLCQKNKFFCDSCCDLQEAEKRMKIKKLPNVLALHLKRFKYQEDVQKYIKLAYRVAFPFELRLFNTVDDAQDPDRLYELFAIVVHIGNGPHHGHYVSIIKTLGSWFVFDDDTVDSIKENDIPKYFGDSNSGSAYVLYYQAIDLDLPALGLQTTSPQTNEQHPPHSPADPPNSSQSSAPVLPPGLVKGDDSSDLSEPSFPVTPSSSQRSPSLPAGEKSPRRIPSQPLTLSITSQEDSVFAPTHTDSSSPPLSAGGASTDSKGGLWNTLRHKPSTKIHGTSNTDHRRSATEKLGRPATSSGAFADLPQSSTPSTANGKVKNKEPERKPSGWFGRRSKTRPETSHGGPSALLSPNMGDEGRSSSSTSSTTWLRNAGHSPMQSGEVNGRPPSDAAYYEFDSKAAPMPPDFHPPAVDGQEKEQHLPDEYHSYPALRSSFASNSVRPISPTSVGFPSKHSVLPPIPASPPGPRHLQPSDHKSSLPRLGGRKHRNGDSYTASMMPARPSTAGASTSRPPLSEAPVPPVPPLPMMPPSTHTRPSNGQPSKEEADSRRPQTARATLGLGLESTNGDKINSNSTSSTSTSTTSNFKRATRKLSLTSPLLGFVKKDKEKQRDKDAHPPSAYPGFLTGSRS